MSGDPVLDRDGDWEIRTSVYLNGRLVCRADEAGPTYDSLTYGIHTALSLREVDYSARYAKEGQG